MTAADIARYRAVLPRAFGPTPGGRALRWLGAAAFLSWLGALLWWFDFSPLRIWNGIGGVMVPLNRTHTTLDWMTALNLPLILVAGSYLGTISHTLTAVAAVKARGSRPCCQSSEPRRSRLPPAGAGGA